MQQPVHSFFVVVVSGRNFPNERIKSIFLICILGQKKSLLSG